MNHDKFEDNYDVFSHYFSI